MTEQEVVKWLGNLKFDEYDTPMEKLPNCPACNEDELTVWNDHQMMCLNCDWKVNL